MRFHLIDRVDCLVPRQSVHARKLTSHLETYWRDDGQGPTMPPSLVLEALCQAGTWLIMCSTDLSQRAALLSIDEVSFGEVVRPGDVLDLHGTVESFSTETAVLCGRVTVGGRTALEASSIMCALLPTADLEDTEPLERMRRQLVRPTVGSR
jgi:3-hydroxyacyl-[acyl-carrier-protein] dehydratase